MRVNLFRHPVTVGNAITSVGTSYASDKKAALTLGSFPAGTAYTGMLSQVTIFVSSIASSAASLSFKLTKDAAGNKILANGDAGSFTLGETTTTGSVTFVTDFDVYNAENDTVYLWCKVNTGTVTIDADSYLIWVE
tara:strand:+ start:34 stop:441 length:408 start_codon:yes stop_codon:yes gene_type:complete